MGELDSVEESDEISDEFEFSDEWSDEVYEKYPTAAGNNAATGRANVNEEVIDGSSSGETAFRHHRASLNAMSKVWSQALIISLMYLQGVPSLPSARRLGSGWVD